MPESTVSMRIAAVVGIGLIGFSFVVQPKPIVIWNASASVPVGLYHVVSGVPMFGDLVLVRTPESVKELADERQYVPSGVPLVKRIGAVYGDSFCVSDSSVFIDGIRAATQLVVDRAGRSLPRWRGCRTLAKDEYFLLADAPDSFDSRYFGPVKRDRVIGRLVPLWTK